MKAIKNAFSLRWRRRDKRGKGSPTNTSPEDVTPTKNNQKDYSPMGDTGAGNWVGMEPGSSNEEVSKRMVIYNNPQEVGCMNWKCVKLLCVCYI